MSNLYYNGNLAKDIKLIKKNTEKRSNFFMKIDLAYLAIIVAYLIFLIGKIINGSSYIPSLALFINSLIISRNIIYIKNTSLKRTADYARSKIRLFADRLFDEKQQSNNTSGKMNIESFEKAIIFEKKEKSKKYDENDELYSYVNVVTNYIYLLDSENCINILKEVKKTIKESDSKKTIESTVELLDLDEYPEELPVKQVLKIKKR